MEYHSSLKLLQATHLKIIAEIQRVCEKNDIRYFVESGTLLGAVRHKAAIPWDDDADIAMLREDFEKFRKIAKKELSPEYVYVEPAELGNNAIFDIVPRVVLLNSQLRPDSPEEQYYGKGIYNHALVDIFIIDDMSDNDFMHKITRGLILALYGMSMGHRYEIDWSKFSGVTKMGVKVLSTIGKIIPARLILRWYEAVSQMGKGKNTKKHRCFYGNTLIQDVKLVFDKKWFEKDCTLTMSGQKVNGPIGWHKVLTTLYHDYMQLPPEDKRTQDHCNFDYIKVWDK